AGPVALGARPSPDSEAGARPPSSAQRPPRQLDEYVLERDGHHLDVADAAALGTARVERGRDEVTRRVTVDRDGKEPVLALTAYDLAPPVKPVDQGGLGPVDSAPQPPAPLPEGPPP